MLPSFAPPMNSLQGGTLFLIVAIAWTLRRLILKSPLDNIPGPKRTSILTGNLGQLFNLNGWQFHSDIAANFGSVIKIEGMLGRSKLYICDPRAMYQILVKDQYSYTKPDMTKELNKLLFGNGLLTVQGDHHRKQRKLMNPVFSIAHMKYMTEQFQAVAARLCLAVRAELGEKKEARELDMLKWMSRTALELVGQAGLDYSMDALVEDTENEYAKAMKNLVPALATLFAYRELLPWFTSPRVKGISARLVSWIPSQGLQRMCDVTNTMWRMSTGIYQAKQNALRKQEEAVSEQVASGKDIMSILLKANMEANEADRLPDEDVVAQMSTLIFAAVDTTSGALSHFLELMAQHPEVQDALRQEIRNARSPSPDEVGISYQKLDSLPLLDACCRETLRLYPPVSVMLRCAREDLLLPVSMPFMGVDGSQINEILVPRGTDVVLSILAINRDKKLWGEDALEWKPSRWLEGVPPAVTDARIPGVYSNLMTFGAGSFSCIGLKFAQLELKAVLSQLLEQFAFELSDKKVVWQMGNIQFPTVKGETKPSFPLRVRMAV